MTGVGDVISVARKSLGMTQAELGDRIGVSQAAINRYELGERGVDDDKIALLAATLGITERLVQHGGRNAGALAVDAHMRRLKTTKASIWRRLEARLNFLRLESSLLFEEISLASQYQIPRFDPDFTDPATAAQLVRAQWRLPIGPVANLTRWVEAAGCLVFEEDFGTPRVDGLSQWIGDHPVILMNSDAPPDRKRLTIAHELGHLVLHSDFVTEDMEGQANAFAAEFLMPEAAIRHQLRRLDLGRLVDLKREWGVSMQAIFERANNLGLVTPAQRTAFYKAMNARGWKISEPGSETIPLEQPELARHIGNRLLSQGLTSDQIDELAGLVGDVHPNPFTPFKRRLELV